MAKKYEVTFWEKITTTVTVEAENEGEAKEFANDLLGDFDWSDAVSQGIYATIVNEVKP